MHVSLGSAVVAGSDVVVRELDGELVMLNLESGMYFGLDKVGTRIWQLIHEYGSLQRVFERMCDEYDVAPDRLERDLLALVGALSAKGLVKVMPPVRDDR